MVGKAPALIIDGLHLERLGVECELAAYLTEADYAQRRLKYRFQSCDAREI